MPDARDLRALPKAHLHVHLESTLRPRTLADLAARHGVEVPPVPARFDGFRAFADLGTLVRSCLREPADFSRVARELCADEAADGTAYLEVTFTAASHGERLGDLEMPLVAVLEGLHAGSREHGIEVRLVLDHSRRQSLARAEATLRLATAYSSAGVVAIGAAGDERHSLAPFTSVWDSAREQGVHLVHHAGEDAGPASIREALDVGHSERLGHGIRILDDPDLVDRARAEGVALEVCPSSNVTLGLVPDLADHPLPRLLDAGLPVTLATDVPMMTGRSLSAEYAAARDTFALPDPVLAAMARAGVDASFAPEPVKRQLRIGIEAWSTTATASR